IELQHGETHDVIIRERDERSPMEPLARARPERRVIGSSIPAQRVQAEGVVEYRLDFGRTACQDDLDLTELSKGACPPANLSPSCALEPSLVEAFPIATEREDRCLDALEQGQAPETGRGRKAARTRQPEDIQGVDAGASVVFDEEFVGRVWRGVRQEKVAERGLAATDERADPHAEPRADAERKRADELTIAPRDLYGELEACAKLAVPLDQPAMQEERARARHRAHESVPGRPQRRERFFIADRLASDGIWSVDRATVHRNTRDLGTSADYNDVTHSHRLISRRVEDWRW